MAACSPSVAPNASAERTQKYAAATNGGGGAPGVARPRCTSVVAQQFGEHRGMTGAKVIEVEAFGVERVGDRRAEHGYILHRLPVAARAAMPAAAPDQRSANDAPTTAHIAQRPGHRLTPGRAPESALRPGLVVNGA